MRAVDIIQKKKEGSLLSKEEISFLVFGFTEGEIPDYQMAAFLMACCFKPLSFSETLELTRAMLNSGKVFTFSNIKMLKVDKHSTGGVGDKTSLIIAPLAASLGVAVPMISGRALGHTGGTLDKLESIPGFNVHLTPDQFETYLREIGVSMIGQTTDIAPADAKIYALRDVTSTVECIPLIAASIMSKKLAEGTDALVLDVKWGNGAFMKKHKDAVELAKWMVKIGKSFEKKVVALVTDMNQPLGQKVGNSLEVEESIEILKGKGPEDLRTLCLDLSGYMLWLGGVSKSPKKGKILAEEALDDGRGLKKFKQMVEIQGGILDVDGRIVPTCGVDSFQYLPKSRYSVEFKSEKNGYVAELNARTIGKAASLLGCGREKVEDSIDHSVGFILHKKLGDWVEKNETLLTIHYNDEKKLGLAMAELQYAYAFSKRKPKQRPLISKIIPTRGAGEKNI